MSLSKEKSIERYIKLNILLVKNKSKVNTKIMKKAIHIVQRKGYVKT